MTFLTQLIISNNACPWGQGIPCLSFTDQGILALTYERKIAETQSQGTSSAVPGFLTHRNWGIINIVQATKFRRSNSYIAMDNTISIQRSGGQCRSEIQWQFFSLNEEGSKVIC